MPTSSHNTNYVALKSHLVAAFAITKMVFPVDVSFVCVSVDSLTWQNWILVQSFLGKTRQSLKQNFTGSATDAILHWQSTPHPVTKLKEATKRRPDTQEKLGGQGQNQALKCPGEPTAVPSLSTMTFGSYHAEHSTREREAERHSWESPFFTSVSGDPEEIGGTGAPLSHML